jgi:UDPglucose 6-dehydrogenase
MTKPVLGFAGMTHLGLVSGVCAAEKGFKVICFDPDSARVTPLTRGEIPVSEPGLPELLAKNKERLLFTQDSAMLSRCDVVYVAPDVPTDDQGRSDLDPIDAMLKSAFGATRDDAIIVVLSQVPPGFTRGRRRPGRILYYEVETLVFGRAAERALNPERTIVGCADPEHPLPPAYANWLLARNCPVLAMRYESAELAKISINCCLVASIATANTLAEISEKIGADWSEIVPALRLDKRIGPHAYLSAGLGIAGGNLERDLATVLRIAGETGAETGLISSFVKNSRHCRDWVLRVLHTEVLPFFPDATIGILGLAYKENTASTKNSPALALVGCLANWRIQAYDPLVAGSPVSHPRFVRVARAEDTVMKADALAVMTPWPQFRSFDLEAAVTAMRGRVVIDPYRVLNAGKVVNAGLDYFTLGARPLRGKRPSDP